MYFVWCGNWCPGPIACTCMEDDQACNGGTGEEGFTELQLHQNGLGRHRRSRLPGPHLKHAGESPEALLQDVDARREDCALAEPSDSGGAIRLVSASTGKGGGARGAGQRMREAGGAGGDRLDIGVMAEAQGWRLCRRRPAAPITSAGGTHR